MILSNSSYVYDDACQLVSEKDHFSAKYDQHYNCIWKNGEDIEVDDLNQRKDESYDLNGNLVRPGFIYDEFDQLVQTENDCYVYDALGRRIQSKSAFYFYIDDEEIGSVEKGKIKELKVLGSMAPVAIEIEGKPYAMAIDVQNTIRQLIDWKTGKSAFENTCDAFGSGITDKIPYAYMGKKYDESTGLLYFGKLFYDPNLRIWLTKDPSGPIDHSNLYQYVFNNPYRFQDPTGENILGFLCGIGQILLGGAIMTSGVVLEVATFGGYSFALGFHEAAGLSLMASGCAMAIYNAQDIKTSSKVFWKNVDVYAPDKNLSVRDTGVDSEKENKETKDKKHSPDQEDLSDIAKDAKKRGLSNEDADTLLEWSEEYNFPNTRDDRGTTHWRQNPKDHIHAGGQDHIPVKR